jgi:hypothetical protein
MEMVLLIAVMLQGINMQLVGVAEDNMLVGNEVESTCQNFGIVQIKCAFDRPEVDQKYNQQNCVKYTTCFIC